MEKLADKVRKATSFELPDILTALLARYEEVFPDWTLTTISLEKEKDRNTQIDSIIRVLQSMKDG